MGALNNPTPKERAETRALCRSICDAVEADLSLPDEVYSRTCARGDVEDFALQLAQEVTLQAEEIEMYRDLESRTVAILTAAKVPPADGDDNGMYLDQRVRWLVQQLAAVTAARDEACTGWRQFVMHDPSAPRAQEWLGRIATLRKAGTP